MRQRLTLYSILLDCGQTEDIATYVNRALLRADWTTMRRLTSRDLIAIWEQQLPPLATTWASSWTPCITRSLASRSRPEMTSA